ncbi:MAG TPA: hypothetical protein VIC26_05830 [Marinagarivorans sp.]
MNTPLLIPVIDFEASGLGLTSYPIEVGLVLANGATYRALIKPHKDWQHWDCDAERVHGISRCEIERDGMPLKSVCEDLNALCEGHILYTDCWAYDYQWLLKLFAAAGMHCNFRLSPVEYLLSEAQMHEWTKQKKVYAHQVEVQDHRALNDAIIISEALDRALLLADGNLRTAKDAMERKSLVEKALEQCRDATLKGCGDPVEGVAIADRVVVAKAQDTHTLHSEAGAADGTGPLGLTPLSLSPIAHSCTQDDGREKAASSTQDKASTEPSTVMTSRAASGIRYIYRSA